MAKQAVNKPANSPQSPLSHLLNHCDNAPAASNTGVILQLHPITGIDSARLLLFSGDALSYMSYRRAQTGKNGTGGRSFLAPRRACSTHIRVARVSRLIGNSDTTAKICLWQVALWWQGVTCGESRGAEKSLAAGLISPNAGNATPFGAASRYSCICHWPPKQTKDGGCLHRSCFRLPDRLLPFEGRSLAVALVGCPVLLWLAGHSSSCRYITGAIYIAISVPFSTLFLFNQL